MTSTTSRLPPPLPPGGLAPATEPLVDIWHDAVARYESVTGSKLPTSLGAPPFDSAEGLSDYVKKSEERFAMFRDKGKHSLLLLRRVEPLAAMVGSLSAALGEGAGIAFPPAKAIFTAVGELIKATAAMHDDYNAICGAFGTIEDHLRIVQVVASEDVHDTLREVSVQLLAQILNVLGVIRKLQKDGRIKFWLKKLAQSKEVSSALNELGRLATNHHQAVSAVSLVTARKTLTMLAESAIWEKEDRAMTRQCLASLARIAKEAYNAVKRLDHTTDTISSNRRILEGIQSTLLRCVSMHDDEKGFAEMDRLCQWLQYPDASLKTADLLQHRTISTGTWFLDGEDFCLFKAGSKRGVWLYGTAGCGKSTMIACAIQDLRAWCACRDSQDLVLTHDFDVTDSSQPRSLRALLSSLLCQVAYHRQDSMAILLKLYKESMNGHSKPTLDALQSQLDAILYRVPARVYVVVDALDEADDTADIVRFLRLLGNYENLSMLVSSRGRAPVHDGPSELDFTEVVMHEDCVNIDIDIVLRNVLSKNGPLGKVKDVALVREALRSGADGNFRWTVLQINELSRIAGIPSKVRQRLKSLPKTLGELYQARLNAIDPEDRADVHRLLIWLLLSYKPLRTAAFAQLLSFDYSDAMPLFDADLAPTSEDSVLALVGSTFVSVHEGKVRLAHASVRDYLLGLPPHSDFHIDHHLAYSLMARTGLAYVSANALSPASGRHPGGRHHLMFTWVVYMAKVDEESYSRLAQDALDVLDPYEHREILNLSLRLLATIGHAQLTRLLVDQLGADVNGLDESGNTPLHYAANAGIHATASFLIERGACVNARTDSNLMPIHHAAWVGDPAVVRLLVDHGADIDAHDGDYGTPLHYAAAGGHEEVMEIFLKKKADTSIRGSGGSTVLHRAAQAGRLGVVDLLLDWPRTVNDPDAVDARHMAPIHYAVMNNDWNVVSLLLRMGADVNAQDGEGNTALHLAAAEGNLEIILLLLGSEAHLDARTKLGLTPLHLATKDDGQPISDASTTSDYDKWRRIRYSQVARTLIYRGAEIDVCDEEGRQLAADDDGGLKAFADVRTHVPENTRRLATRMRLRNLRSTCNNLWIEYCN